MPPNAARFAATARIAARIAWFFLGIVIMTAGLALIIRAGLGAPPWDIFHLGLGGKTGVPLGLVIQLTGLAVILLDIALGVRPTIGMVLNMLSVGPILQFLLPLIATPDPLAGRLAVLGAGIALEGVGTGIYVSAGLGTGPRDGLMVGLTRRTGLPVGLVRNGIDITASLSGWRLDGPLGVGTVINALLIGPLVQLVLSALAKLAEHPVFRTFVSPIDLKRRRPSGRQGPRAGWIHSVVNDSGGNQAFVNQGGLASGACRDHRFRRGSPARPVGRGQA